MKFISFEDGTRIEFWSLFRLWTSLQRHRLRSFANCLITRPKVFNKTLIKCLIKCFIKCLVIRQNEHSLYVKYTTTFKWTPGFCSPFVKAGDIWGSIILVCIEWAIGAASSFSNRIRAWNVISIIPYYAHMVQSIIYNHKNTPMLRLVKIITAAYIYWMTFRRT